MVQVVVRGSGKEIGSSGSVIVFRYGNGGASVTAEAGDDLDRERGDSAVPPGHPFYQRLNELLESEKFDEFVEGRCRQFYASKMGRPGLVPGVYFRSLLIGYFEGIDSERGIA